MAITEKPSKLEFSWEKGDWKIHLLYASITILVLGWLFFRKTFHEKKGSSKYIHTKKNVDMVRDLSSILSFNYALTVFACYLTLSIQNQEKTFSEKHYIIFGSVLLVFLIKAALIYLNTLENDND